VKLTGLSVRQVRRIRADTRRSQPKNRGQHLDREN